MSELPTSWIEPAISAVAEVNPRKDVDLSASDLVSFEPMAAVDEITGTIMTRGGSAIWRGLEGVHPLPRR